jgi:hypothetical protein
MMHFEVMSYAFKSLNISIVKPGHEECESCEEFTLHNSSHTENNLDQNCEHCSNWSVHIDKASQARNEYRRDAQTNRSNAHVVFSVDLEEVIMLPRIDMFKAAVCTRRIIAFNESFVPVGTKQNLSPMAALWHEGTSGRT